jgi:hypothetical protein
MYVNRKMIPAEAIPGMGEGEIKEDGEGEFKYDIFDIRAFVNATVYTQHKKKCFKSCK